MSKITNDDRITVVYICDDSYAWITGISMISLFEHNKNATAYVIGQNISSENKRKLLQTAERYDGNCILIDIPNRYLPKELNLRRWPSIVFARLFLGSLLPASVNKVLYLDCDTLVNEDLRPLWDIDVKHSIFSGVKDYIGKKYKENIGLSSTDFYINAGVLLINVDRLRAFPLPERLTAFFKQYYHGISYADQDVLNSVFKGKIGCLPSKYNVMTLQLDWAYSDMIKLRHPSNCCSEEEYEYARKYPAIVHFTEHLLSTRPWFENSNHPYVEHFAKYKADSLWNDQPLAVKFHTGYRARISTIYELLPEKILFPIIGFIHAVYFPCYISAKQQFHRWRIRHDDI